MGNILETLRLVANHYRDRLHPDGMPMLTFLVDLVSVLWHVGEVRDQRILAAGLLHRIVADGLIEEQELEAIVGPELMGIIGQVGSPEALAPADFQRLQGAKTRQRTDGARKICMAIAIARARQAHQMDQPPSAAFKVEILAMIEPFADTLPHMQRFLAPFLAEPGPTED